MQDVPICESAGDGRLEFSHELESAHHIYYRVRPYDRDGELGVPSELVQFPGGPPVIESVAPMSGRSGEQVTFAADIADGIAVEYSWDFGGGAEPNTSSSAEPTVTLQSPGDYAASVAVGSPYGNDTLGFILRVDDSAPEIVWVQPTTGQQDTEVVFTAQVIGSPTLAYHWDFDGGAEPDYSDLETPTVVLGDAGEYNARFTAINDLGWDSVIFTLLVTDKPPIVAYPEITAVEPTVGYTGREATFTASIKGTAPFEYEWDFGGGATPNAPQLANPTVTLRAPGSYPANHTSLNSAGEDTFDFVLTVLEVPTVTVDGRIVERMDDEVGIPGITVEITDGDFAPAITDAEGYYEIRDVPIGYRTVKPANSGWLFWPVECGITISEEQHTVNFDALHTNWHVRVVDDWVPDGGDSSLAIVNGRPSVSYYWRYDTGGTQLRYKTSDDDDGLAWDSAAVIVASAGMPPLSVGRFNSLLGDYGRPAISCAGSPYYFKAIDYEGNSWYGLVSVAEDTLAEYTALLAVNGRPAIAYVDRYVDGIRYVRADSSSFYNWGEPVSLYEGYLPDNRGCPRIGFAIINGNPAVSYPDPYNSTEGKVMFRRANDENGDSWNTPVTAVTGYFPGYFSSLLEVNGNPAVFYTRPSGIPEAQAIMYTRATDAQGLEWSEPVIVCVTNKWGIIPSQAIIVDGRPAIAAVHYGGYYNGFLDLLISEDTIGSEWGEHMLIDYRNVEGCISAAVVNGHPAVTYYSDHYGELRYAVYIP